MKRFLVLVFIAGDRRHDRGRALSARACAGALAARHPGRDRHADGDEHTGGRDRGRSGRGKTPSRSRWADPGADEPRQHRRRADHGRCARHRPGHEQRHGEEPGRRQAGRDRLSRRPGREEGRHHRPHRSRDLQGALRQRGRQEGPGRGAARQRPGGSRALPEARRDAVRFAPAGRHPKSARGAIYRPARPGSGRDRQHARRRWTMRRSVRPSTGGPASGSWTRATSSTRAIRPAS